MPTLAMPVECLCRRELQDLCKSLAAQHGPVLGHEVLGYDAIVSTGKFFGARHLRASGAAFMAPVWRPAATTATHMGRSFEIAFQNRYLATRANYGSPRLLGENRENFPYRLIGKFPTQEATAADGSAVVTKEAHLRVLLEHILLANQINERLNAKRSKLRINTTQMLILTVLPQIEGRAPAQAECVKGLATRLQLSRETVSAQLKGLAEDGLVSIVEPAANQDRRWKWYRITRAGQSKALFVLGVLAELDRVFRALLGDELARSHPRTLQLLVTGLPTAPSLDNARAVARFCEQKIRERREVNSAGKAKRG